MLPISYQCRSIVSWPCHGLRGRLSACCAGCWPPSASSSAAWPPARCSAPARRPTWSAPSCVGGLAGAVIMVAASFIGVALVGAGLGAAAVTLIWTQVTGDPHPYLVVLAVGGRRVAGDVAAALRDHRRHRVRRRLGRAGRRARRHRRQGQAGGRGGRRRVGAVSDAAGAGRGVGAVGVVALGLGRRAGAALRHRRQAAAGW